MAIMPGVFFLTGVIGLLSLVLVGGGVYLIWQWSIGALVGIAYLIAGLFLVVFTFAGRFIVLALLARAGADDPHPTHSGTVQRVQGADGNELHVEVYGPADGIPLILTHGWSLNSSEWYYLKQHLAERFRLITWDLRGLGQSSQPANQDYAIEKMARDLAAVLALAEHKPAILVGHSIGGMVLLTFCRLFPQTLSRQVAGLVLVQTTYTNPLKTAIFSPVLRALQKPVLEPLAHLTIWLWPLAWLMTWLGYLNGFIHILVALLAYAGHETRGQLDFTARFQPLDSPAVLGRGTLAMFKFDESATLGRITAPVLLIAGDADRLTLPEASVQMQSALPRPELVTVPAGHMGVFEQHERVNQTIAAFALSHAGVSHDVLA